VTVEFKKFGVGLEFTPTVLKDGIINLKISPEVSEIDVSNSVKFGDIEIPSLTVRRATTTVQLRDGQSFVMAGLLQSSSEVSRRQFPWLSDIPVLGALFRSTSYRRKETDLVIIVTPRLVRPIEPGKRIRTPLDDTIVGNDVDVFLRGKDERKPSNVHRLARGEGSPLPTGHIMELN
jgi:pilus assembly protein CpaC